MLIRTRCQNCKEPSFLNTLKQETRLNNTQKFSYYLTLKRLRHYYNHQSVNSVQGKTYENHTNPINTLSVHKAKIFKTEAGGTYVSHSDVQDSGKYVGVRDELLFLWFLSLKIRNIQPSFTK